MMPTMRQAHDAFYTALNAVWAGDIEPMRAAWSEQPDVTLLPPFGDRLQGPGPVIEQFQRLIDMGMGGDVRDCDAICVESDAMGYSVCVEEGHTVLDGETIPVRHRATNVFRKEADGWRLVHHHTDLAPDLGSG
jgi:ketosteroid isomerase-like protein